MITHSNQNYVKQSVQIKVFAQALKHVVVMKAGQVKTAQKLYVSKIADLMVCAIEVSVNVIKAMMEKIAHKKLIVPR